MCIYESDAASDAGVDVYRFRVVSLVSVECIWV